MENGVIAISGRMLPFFFSWSGGIELEATHGALYSHAFVAGTGCARRDTVVSCGAKETDPAKGLGVRVHARLPELE